MSKYVFLITLFHGFLTYHSAFGQQRQNQLIVSDEIRPNIIFILTDDQRNDALGFAGNPYAHTPEMDALAREGTYFSHAMVTTPICAASRASILTGVYERAHRYDFSSERIADVYMHSSYPEILKNYGYTTGFFGKYGVRYADLQRQFHSYESYDRNGMFKDHRGYYYKTLGKDTVHLSRYTGQQAIDFIKAADTKIPFCLSLSFSAPHAHDSAEKQYFWQKESDSLLQHLTIPEPDLAQDSFFLNQPKFVRDGFNRVRWKWRYDTPEKYQHSLKGYYRMIAGIDREIGKIRRALASKGLEKNTVIIVMGDNGYFLGERQLAGKWLLYDNSIRVPLIIYDPRNPIATKRTDLALNVDIPATILDMAGLSPPGHWQGQSLLPLVRDPTKEINRDTVLIEHLWEFEHIPPSEGLRTNTWKYFRYVNDKSVEELYDLGRDPREVNNLAQLPEYASKLAIFRKSCDNMIARLVDKRSEGPTGLKVQTRLKTESDKSHLNSAAYNWIPSVYVEQQTAYQILVASSKENLDQNIADIWDSGKVASTLNSGILHKGHELERQEYFWKVRLWDDNKQMSRYSDISTFKIGS